MAESFLSILIDAVFEKLSSAAMERLQLGWGVYEGLDHLRSTLSASRAVLEDAEERQLESTTVRDWLQKLKQVTYEADDLLDEIAIEAQQQKLKTDEIGTSEAGGKKRKRGFWDYISSFLNSSQWEMPRRIRDINMQLDRITKERNDLHLKTRDGKRRRLEIGERPPVGSVINVSESKVFGRENDAEEIIKALLSDDDSGNKGNFSAIAIVGMGGLGKTTLAQLVYNDDRVIKHFAPRAWVCVSEDFDVKRLTKEIIASANRSGGDLSDIDSLQCSLRDQLREKKFLVVLDDVWTEISRYWEVLRTPFTFGAKGSKVLVTTRSESVSAVFRPACTHRLKGLSRDDCWQLLLHRAFIDDNINDYPELLEIGNQIVEKCKGLPLAVKALGGLLSSTREVSKWDSILKSPTWNLPGPAREIFPALLLSYEHLPVHLKPCFTFCSIYPKHHKFVKEDLIQLWIANGFIHSEAGKWVEDTGLEYFNDLLLRSFFEDSRFGYYTMHDLFHDMAQSISGGECLQMEGGKLHGVLTKIRHLSYSVVDEELINFEAFYESKGLRTFLLMQGFNAINRKIPHKMFNCLRSIRVLDLSYINITELPNSISNLRHLRYLNLEATDINKLPESLCSIYNLQTLILSECRLVQLPNKMNELINLCHLDLTCCPILSMPPQIGRLTSLQTLPLFVVGREKERGIAELKNLTNICGILRIDRLENVAEAEEARQANLKNKPFIDQLELLWSDDYERSLRSEQVQDKVLEGLQPHPNIKMLYCNGYLGTQFPSWLMKMDILCNLTKVVLIDCKRCSTLPPLGYLPFLSYVSISGMDEVKQIGQEFYCKAGSFPSLEELHLGSMLNLERWHGIAEVGFPYLRRLTISECPQLRQMPHGPFPNLTTLDIRSCGGFISLPQLPSLENVLVLANLEKWCGTSEASFPHLRQVFISHCPKMTEWPSISDCLKQRQMPCSPFPNLTTLDIRSCAGFVSLPQLPAVEELYLEGLANLEKWCGSGKAGFPCLRRLIINRCPKITEWPNVLSALTELSVSNCQGFGSLPFIPSLCKLILHGSCERLLNSVPCLTWLSSLAIIEFPKLTSVPLEMLQELTHLKELSISRCEELVTLIEENELQCGGLPSTLTHLTFFGCSNLKSLPSRLHALTSLQSLKIVNCPQVTSLPELGLPLALQSLEILGCPFLQERCLKDRGEEWPKISHIPHVKLKFKFY